MYERKNRLWNEDGVFRDTATQLLHWRNEQLTVEQRDNRQETTTDLKVSPRPGISLRTGETNEQWLSEK